MGEPQEIAEFTDGKCKWCGREGEVYRNNGYCEDCDSDIVPCVICQEDQHYDDPCRHIFRAEDYEWSGAGTGWQPSDTVRNSFQALVRAMPGDFLPHLKRALKRGKFHTFLCAPLIGGGGILELNGIPFEEQRRFGERFIVLGCGNTAGELFDGYSWLASLDDDQTPKANTTTLAWLSALQREGKDHG